MVVKLTLFMVLFYITIQDSPMLSPAYKYLTLRSLGAPAVLLSLAMQGVFRGFKDTKTPLYAIGKFPILHYPMKSATYDFTHSLRKLLCYL